MASSPDYLFLHQIHLLLLLSNCFTVIFGLRPCVVSPDFSTIWLCWTIIPTIPGPSHYDANLTPPRPSNVSLRLSIHNTPLPYAAYSAITAVNSCPPPSVNTSLVPACLSVSRALTHHHRTARPKDSSVQRMTSYAHSLSMPTWLLNIGWKPCILQLTS